MPSNKKTKQECFASNPFMLRLDDEPYELSAEGLKKKVDESLQKKRNWFYPTIKFISLTSYITYPYCIVHFDFRFQKVGTPILCLS
jgi:hypothetical protein